MILNLYNKKVIGRMIIISLISNGNNFLWKEMHLQDLYNTQIKSNCESSNLHRVYTIFKRTLTSQRKTNTTDFHNHNFIHKWNEFIRRFAQTTIKYMATATNS